MQEDGDQFHTIPMHHSPVIYHPTPPSAGSFTPVYFPTIPHFAPIHHQQQQPLPSQQAQPPISNVVIDEPRLRSSRGHLEKLASSRAHTYPLKGISFLAQNPSLLWAVLVPVLTGFALGLGVFIFLMLVGLYPQALLFMNFTSLLPWESWLLSLALVFLEVTLLMLFLSQVLIEKAQRSLYVKVFELHGLPFDGLDRVVYGEGSGYAHWFSQRAILLFLLFQLIITMPINAMPVIGSFCYAGLNGVSLAWALQGSYFEKKGLSFMQQWHHVKTHAHDYFAFGTVAMLLDCVPVCNMVFFYTNIIGSALWAVEMEKAQQLENSQPANALIDEEDELGLVDSSELY